MLYSIMLEVKAAIEAKGCPIPVVYGPELFSNRGLTDERIVFERDRQGGDSNVGPRSQQRNPKLIGVRRIGAVVRIYASSTIKGAGVHDHERKADQIADLVEVAVRRVTTVRKTIAGFNGWRFLTAAELERDGLTQWPGAVYQGKCFVDRAVLDASWGGDGADESDGYDIASRTMVGGKAACGGP